MKRRKTKRKIKNNSLHIFVMYTLSIISISIFLFTFLTIKTQCLIMINDIEELNKATSNNLGIVKKLQSDKIYFTSESYIASKVKPNMIAIAPEPEIIVMNNEQ